MIVQYSSILKVEYKHLEIATEGGKVEILEVAWKKSEKRGREIIFLKRLI